MTIGKFKTITEATDWAAQQYPPIEWDFVGTQIETINPTLAQFHKLAHAYPDVTARLEYFGTYQGNNSPRRYFWPVTSFAHASPDGKCIGLNPLWYGDARKLQKRLEFLESMGQFAQGSAAIGYLISHEFGHQLENWLRSLTSKAVLDVVGADGAGLVAETLTLWQKNHKATPALSDYALENEREGWAEGFAAQYHTPKARWTAYVKAQRQLLRSLDVSLHTDSFTWYSDIVESTAQEEARNLLRAFRKRLAL